jgi:hypothetical protein
MIILLPIVVFIVLSGTQLADWITILLPIFLAFGEIVSTFVVQYAFNNSMGPVILHSNGLEPPRAWIHRLTGRHPFISKEEIATLRSSTAVLQYAGGPYLSFSLKDRKGRNVLFGLRLKEDVVATLDYAKRDWKIPIDSSFDITSMNRGVEQRTQGASSPSMAHKIQVGNVNNVPSTQQPLIFCPNCGARAVPEGEFCPMCGHRDGQPVMRFMPPPQTVAPPPSIPAPPPVVEERSPLPSYLQKSTKLAFFLAFLPGLFCIMGLGHFYAKKVIKGVILLVIGFFPGLLAWVSLFMVFTETKYEISVYIIMTMFLWAIFAALLLWSAFDASKQVRKFNALPPEKLLRSKDGLSDGGFRKSRF